VEEGEDIICFCEKADEEPVDWMSFLYGGLTGLGAFLLLALTYQLLCRARTKSRSSGFEIGMSDYVRDDV
jgi:hypothetical protein